MAKTFLTVCSKLIWSVATHQKLFQCKSAGLLFHIVPVMSASLFHIMPGCLVLFTARVYSPMDSLQATPSIACQVVVKTTGRSTPHTTNCQHMYSWYICLGRPCRSQKRRSPWLLCIKSPCQQQSNSMKSCAVKMLCLACRSTVGMTVGFLRSYSLGVIHTCHKRGVHAMGGMAAQIPIKNDPKANQAAVDKAS